MKPNRSWSFSLPAGDGPADNLAYAHPTDKKRRKPASYA
jgi:hypothetical protein